MEYLVERSDFSECMSMSLFHDIILVSEDLQVFKAHKFMLYSCSTVLKNLLLKLPASNPTLFLTGIMGDEVKSLLAFMYKGETIVSQENLSKFMDIAETMKILGLTGEILDLKRDSIEVLDKSMEEFVKNIKPDNELHDNTATVDDTEPIISEIVTENKILVDKTNDNELLYCRIQNSEKALNENIEKSDEGWRCLPYGKFKERKDHLVNHYEAKHSTVKNYSCNVCEQTFKIRQTMQSHIRTVHSVLVEDCEDKDISSTSIESSYTKLEGAEKALEEKISKKKGGWFCLLCGKEKKKKEHIINHAEARHTGIS